MSDQDWTTVTLKKNVQKKPKELSTSQLAQAKASGLVSTEKKQGAAENKSTASGVSLRKIEEDTESFSHTTVDRSISKAITQARMAKKMTQAQLATSINERPQIIQEYESGRAIPNPAILNKLDRALGIHLPRPRK